MIVGQCAYCRAEFDAGVADCGEVTADAALDPDVLAAARQSLERIRTLAPRRLHFSHERTQPHGAG